MSWCPGSPDTGVSTVSTHCSSQSRGQPRTRGSALVSATDTHWMGMAGDVPGPVSSARAWALCTEDRMSEGMSPSWPQPVQPAKIARQSRRCGRQPDQWAAGDGPGRPICVRGGANGGEWCGPGAVILGICVVVLVSARQQSTCPPLSVSGQAPCSPLTAQLTPAHSSADSQLPAPATLCLSLCQPSLPTVSLVRDKLLLQRDGYQARQILHSVQRKK